MNKKEAIAYAQIALDDIQRGKNIRVSLVELALSMKSAFRLYDRNLAINIAEAKVSAENELQKVKGATNGK